MSEFTVTLSELRETAGAFTKQSENFRNTSDLMLQATQQLADGGWDDVAGEAFKETVAELDRWVKTMSELADNYSKNLEVAANTYEEADRLAAKTMQG